MIEIQRDVGVLADHLQTIKERLSQSRKQGMDTKMVEIQLMNINPKIMLAKATGARRDFDLARQMLAELESEMKGLRKEERFEDVLRTVAEVEKERLESEENINYVNLGQDEIIAKTNNLIKQANEFLEQREFEKVFHIYGEIQGIYKYLPRDLKARVYKEAINIYRKLRQSGIFKQKSRLRMLARTLRRFAGL